MRVQPGDIADTQTGDFADRHECDGGSGALGEVQTGAART